MPQLVPKTLITFNAIELEQTHKEIFHCCAGWNALVSHWDTLCYIMDYARQNPPVTKAEFSSSALGEMSSNTVTAHIDSGVTKKVKA